MATQFSESEKPQWRRTFFPIWIGQAISLIGSRLVGFALVWYLTESTGSAIILTTISLIGMLPEMVLSPFAGALVDRWDRRKVMIIADSLIALTTLFLAFLFISDIVEIWHIYVLMFVRSVGGAFHFSAMGASTSLMVPKEKLVKIQGLNQLLQSILIIIAAPLGALVLEFLDVGKVLFIDVFTALIAIIPLIFIALPQPDVVTSEEQRANPIRTMMQDVRVGFHYVVSWKGLFYVLILATFINALLNPAFSLIPLLVRNTFNRGAAGLASIQTSMGIGMLIGSLILSAWGGFKNKVFTSSLGLLGNAIGVLLMAFAPPSAFWIVIAGATVFGITNPIVNGPLLAMMQETIDPSLQGRVFSLINTTAMAASPIGLALAGPLSEYFGVQSWFMVGGFYCIFMATVIIVNPKIRNLQDGPPQQSGAENSKIITASVEQ